MAGFVLVATLASAQVGEHQARPGPPHPPGPHSALPWFQVARWQGWHGTGAAHWGAIQNIVPRSYSCPRVNPAKPVKVNPQTLRAQKSRVLKLPWLRPIRPTQTDVSQLPLASRAYAEDDR